MAASTAELEEEVAMWEEKLVAVLEEDLVAAEEAWVQQHRHSMSAWVVVVPVVPVMSKVLVVAQCHKNYVPLEYVYYLLAWSLALSYSQRLSRRTTAFYDGIHSNTSPFYVLYSGDCVVAKIQR